MAQLTITAEVVKPSSGIVAALGKELEYLEAETAKEATVLRGETARVLASAWLVLHRCGELAGDGPAPQSAGELVHKYGLSRPLEEELCGEATATDDLLAELDVPSLMALFRLLLQWECFTALSRKEQADLLPEFVNDKNVALFIGLHNSGGHEWFIKERWKMLFQWLNLAARVAAAGNNGSFQATAVEINTDLLVAAADKAGYRLDRLLLAIEC